MATIGQFVVWKRDYTAEYTKGESHKFEKNSIHRIVDIDGALIWFNHILFVHVLNLNVNTNLFDSFTEASEFVRSQEHAKASSIWSAGAPAMSGTLRSYISGTDYTPKPELEPSMYGFNSIPKEPTTATFSPLFKMGDDVTFTRDGEYFKFIIGQTALVATGFDDDDDDIFHNIDLTTSKSIETFASVAYGYSTTHEDGEFPNYKKDDMQAAERIISAIKARCSRLDREEEEERELEKKEAERKLAAAKFEYVPNFPKYTKVIFDTGRVSLEYTVNSHFMTCVNGWDAIYKELGVNPASFIEKATGKPAMFHPGGQAYGIMGGDYKSSDKIIDALKQLCWETKLKRNAEKFASGSSLHQNSTPSKSPNLRVSLNGLEVKELSIH